jgi:SAM-dependent methyltransferase
MFRRQKRAFDYGELISFYRFDSFARESALAQVQSRFAVFDHVLDQIEAVKKAGVQLDVGCGSGFLLGAAKQGGWKVMGVEPSTASVEAARKEFDVQIVRGTLQDLEQGIKFDVITMINVLDQSGEPWRELEKGKDLLEDNGLIVIRVPNGQLHSYLMRIKSKFGANQRLMKFLVFHEYSFTAQFLGKMLKDKGFRNVTTRSSPPSQGDPYKLFPSLYRAGFIKAVAHAVGKYTEALTFNRIHLGSSLETMAVV